MTDEPRKPVTDFPEAIAGQSRWSLFLVWLIPVVVVFIGGWLATRAIIERGPTIFINFKTAEGLEAGKTKIKYKNVDIGEVRSISLSEDRSIVVVKAQMTKEAESFLVEDTRFWIVRPRVAGGSVSGLGTLLSGSYIGVDAGKVQRDRRQFVGLEVPPVVTRDLVGRQFALHGDDLGSLDIGSPIFFRRIEVGQVVAFELDKDGKGVTLQVFVNAPYDRYVKKNSRFWHASGFDVSLDVNGFRIDTESLAAIIVGGIAFQTPADASAGPPADASWLFNLAATREQAMTAPDTISETYVMKFPESVRGLAPGAPVDFGGVVVGEVSSVDVDYDPAKRAFTIPVEIRLYPDRFRAKYKNGKEPPDTRRILDRLIERGFRGQLRVGNLVTQQLYIALDFFPEAPKAKADWSKTPAVLPTVPGAMEELQVALGRILKKLEKVPLDAIGQDLRQALQSLDGTLRRANKLITRVDAEVVPEVRAALGDTRKALGSVDGALAGDAPLQQDMREALHELTRAAQSLRVLADYLEQHPEAILRGKKKEEER